MRLSTSLPMSCLCGGPGIAAIIVCLLFSCTFRTFGWRFPRPKYLALAAAIPPIYAIAIYVPLWTTGIAPFNPAAMPSNLPLFFAFGLPVSFVAAAGEEIGWRGFLVPHLFSHTGSYATTALASGLIWAGWHFPFLLFYGYNAGTPLAYLLSVFTVLAVCISFVLACLRLASGSL